MWGIRNKRTGKWVYGTDYRYYPPHQRTSDDRALILETEEDALREMRYRKCGNDYEAVPVRLEALED